MAYCLKRQQRTSSRGIAVIGKEKDVPETRKAATLSLLGVKWGDMG